MKRCHKKGSDIYFHLEQIGLLEHGTTEQIEQAKKEYWKQFRAQYKQQYRKEYKSYTVFFSTKQQHLLAQAASNKNCSVNQFIKNTCVNLLDDAPNIDKRTIGKIRQALALFHTDLESATACVRPLHQVMDDVVKKFIILETTILSLLKK